MSKTNFKVIDGGLLETAENSRKVFRSAYITNTRLMGVIGLYIHWNLPDNKTITDFHQFFYLDAEEYGFDTYKSVLGTDTSALMDAENSLIGGLGGKKVEITKEEAFYTIQQYVKLNEKTHEPLPEGASEYQFILDEHVKLTEPEIYVLMSKQCVNISNTYELINYFLMRAFSKDFGAASFLSTQNFDIDLFPDFKAATFYKNKSKPTDIPGEYLCESLIEFDETYHIVMTKVSASGHYIDSFSRVSSMSITAQEAAMQLMRSEFISVFGEANPIEHNRNMTNLTKTAMITNHANGDLYMIFNPNNAHVCKQQYRLNEDVLGLYYFSVSNQLIIGAYSLEEIRKLEEDLANSKIAKDLVPLSKYEFVEPVLYEFINSGIEDFEEFVDLIKK